MAGNEKTSSDVPLKALPVEKEAIPKALPVLEKGGKTTETQETPKKTKQQETQEETKKALEASKKSVQDQQILLGSARQRGQRIDDESDAKEALFSWSDSPKSPSSPTLLAQENKKSSSELFQKPIQSQNNVELTDLQKKKQVFQEQIREQENKTAKAIEGKMNSELESVTKNGTIDQLDPSIQQKIRTEVVRTSIDANLLPDEKKKEILSTMKGADGQPLFSDISKVNLKNLAQYQKDFILKSDTVKNLASGAIEEYKKMQEEAKKTGKELDPKVIEEFCKGRGLPNTDALELSQLRNSNMKPTDFPANSQIGIVQRVLAESTFNELRDTLADGMKWSHVPEMVKREIGRDSFSAESGKNTSEIQQAIIEAKAMIASPDFAKQEGETPAQFETRFKEKTGVSASGTSDLEARVLESRKSGLSPGMRALADFFGPIGAALGMPFWKEYMGENLGRDDTADTSERYMTKDGNNEYTGEVGTQSPELAQNGFKGDVMNSIWRWEYQKGRDVEIIPLPAGKKSGLTLCGGIDLAYTPYSQVQNIFKNILSPTSISKLQPFCENGGRRGPVGDGAKNLLRAKVGLKEEIDGQLNYQNMGEAFTRSLAIDWQRLVNKHGDVVKNAPGYIQVFMLSRFYHAGIGGSNRIIQQVIASKFNHDSVVSIAENFRNTRSESYYRNRMGKEINYLRSRPGDAVAPASDVAQNGQGAELNQGQSAVQWFEKNAGKPYGGGEGRYDCMTSTHAALGLNYTKDYSGAFNGKFIDQKNDKNNLWNVAMASALYVKNITSANSEAKDGIITKQPNGYYGEKSGEPTNMEYYIEENIMKRVKDNPAGIEDVGGKSGKLIHYSKSRKGAQGIVDDIIKNERLKPGESAMMGATGKGTNKGGHEWLVVNEGGNLKVYESTNTGEKDWRGKVNGISGKGLDLKQYLQKRPADYSDEAIIFAKKG